MATNLRASSTLQLNATVVDSYWQSTGLYAAPGTVVTVTLPPALAALAATKLINLQIGCHTDRLWKKTDWYRLPEVVRRFPARGDTTKIGSSIGGLIYIILPTGLSLGPVKVTITGAWMLVHGLPSMFVGNKLSVLGPTVLAAAKTLKGDAGSRLRSATRAGVERPGCLLVLTGAIRAARFVNGVDSVVDWARSMRSAPAPWGELESKKIVISTHLRSALMLLDNPFAVLLYWNKVGQRAAAGSCAAQ